MKKTLIAVAALAATSAFAQVTVSGTMDATFRMIGVDRADGTSYDRSLLQDDGLGTTGFILSGTEDLGGGLKAVFLYEQNFDIGETATTATTGANDVGGGAQIANQWQGQQFVGLEGAFGSIKLGTPNTPSLTIQGARGASFGTKDGGRANSAGFGTALTRFDNSIVYTTPNFSGFTVGLMYVPETDTAVATTTGSQMDLGLLYANGPIAAGVSQYSVDEGSAGSEVGQTNFYGSYNFGFAKFTLGGHTHKTKNVAGATTAENTGLNVAADVPLSPALTLTVNVQQLNDKFTTNADKDSVAVGVQYALSKRTTTYARYINVGTDNQTGAAIKDVTTMLVGVRHNF